MLTDNETLHLVLPYYLNVQCLFYPIIVFKSTPTGCHDAQFLRRRAIELLVVSLQLLQKLYA